MSRKPTICVDFDGVIHAYSKGWTSADDVYDDPTPGAKEALEELRKSFKVVVLSTRFRSTKGLWAASKWLEKHGITPDDLSHTKVPAVAYIDDRAINFSGDWQQVLRDVAGFQPWTKAKLGVYRVGGEATVVAYDEDDAVLVLREAGVLSEDEPASTVRSCDDEEPMEYDDGKMRWSAPCWVLAKALGRSVLGMTEP